VASASSPTPERLARGPVAPPRIDETHFRPFWRACDRIEKLCAAGLITLHEARSAAAFRALYERAHAGPGALRAADLSALRAGKHCRRPVPAMTEAQATALARLRRIREALGALYELLEMAVIEELPWSAIGERLDVDQRTARAWCVAGLAALAAALA
jgi:hypothetical protein